jgi:hypothetical protein
LAIIAETRDFETQDLKLSKGPAFAGPFFVSVQRKMDLVGSAVVCGRFVINSPL